MKKKKITDFLIKLLKKKRPIKKLFLKDMNKFNFIDSGHVDSLELITFNFMIEKKFKIKFSHKDLSSKKFGIVSGLTEIIYKKISNKIK